MISLRCSTVLTSGFRGDPNQWRLLLLDGHGSHKTLEFVTKCLDHKVSICSGIQILHESADFLVKILPFCFIPHSTHLCQPLDVITFSMMQKEYGNLVRVYTKQGLHINKTNFSLLLREVRDKVLTPSNNVKAFETCGYYPFNFEASYANRHVPPSHDPTPEDNEREWEDVPITTNNTEDTVTTTLLLVAPSPPATPIAVRTESLARSRATTAIRVHPLHTAGSPHSQRLHRQKPFLRSLQTRIEDMRGNATPRRVREIRKAALPLARVDYARNEHVATLVNITEMQQEVIEKFDARHMMDTQLIEHLKIQLANKNRPREVGGAVLRTGYGGAMDSETLNVLQAEVSAKERDKARKEQEKERKKDEREQKRLETARAKEARAAAKAAENAEQIGERGSGHGRGRAGRAGRARGVVGRGQGRGGGKSGGQGRGRGRGRGQAPVDEENEESEDGEEELTEDDPSTHETNSTVSTGSRTDAKDSEGENTPNPDLVTSNPPSPAANVVSSGHCEGPEDPGGCLRLRRRAVLPKRYC